MYEPRSIFWPTFWAMLAALVVFNLLKWGLALALAAGLVASWNAGSPSRTTTPGHQPARPGAVYQRPALPAAPERLLGPLGAVRTGSSRACIDGVAADRVDNGWRQLPDRACLSTSR